MVKEKMKMKCKDCQYCSQRGGYQYFFCDKDNGLIEPNDYYRGKEMDCSITQKENDEFFNDYIFWQIARK